MVLESPGFYIKLRRVLGKSQANPIMPPGESSMKKKKFKTDAFSYNYDTRFHVILVFILKSVVCLCFNSTCFCHFTTRMMTLLFEVGN